MPHAGAGSSQWGVSHVLGRGQLEGDLPSPDSQATHVSALGTALCSQAAPTWAGRTPLVGIPLPAPLFLETHYLLLPSSIQVVPYEARERGT